ncbi:phosphatase PAP2 family protein [Lichenifustis flavocetrariae]|uniref:Phosphatase PAP2 family protein n=1 Tax=Lichenifustis flavocetrariae TaxID=2949735 RepID=A0AA42CKF2_9HYPH|nr:phosphatase PAP2 family protein [Lichenifustis flavocetrariae]MCW6510518.1 phosphatase PAP2 family protein [Lichenifustis flavocetrariae]
MGLIRSARLWVGLTLLLIVAGDLYVVSLGQNGLDVAIILSLRTPGYLADPLGPAWLAETGRDLTGLGSNGVMGLVVFTVAGGLLLLHRWQHLLALVLSSGSALLCNALLKIAVHRPRPHLVPGTPLVFTTSFPSSHAMLSAATFFTLAGIVAASSTSRSLARFCFVMAGIGTGLIGLSRIYLAVHWPTDVLGGWAGGLFCALVSWTLAGRFSDAGTAVGTDRSPPEKLVGPAEGRVGP